MAACWLYYGVHLVYNYNASFVVCDAELHRVFELVVLFSFYGMISIVIFEMCLGIVRIRLSVAGLRTIKYQPAQVEEFPAIQNEPAS